MNPEEKKEIAKYYRQTACDLEEWVREKRPGNHEAIKEHVDRLRKEADELDPSHSSNPESGTVNLEPGESIARHQWRNLAEALDFEGTAAQFERGLKALVIASEAKPSQTMEEGS